MSEEINENEEVSNVEQQPAEEPREDSNIPSAEQALDMGTSSEVEHIMKLAESNPAIKDLPEYKNMMATVEKVRQDGTTQNTQEEETEESVEAEEEVQEEVQEEAQEVEEESVEDDDSNPFGINTSNKKRKGKELIK